MPHRGRRCKRHGKIGHATGHAGYAGYALAPVVGCAAYLSEQQSIRVRKRLPPRAFRLRLAQQ